eukprot:TRINITY_DN3237_c0_g1_i3.p1 TRINITY_DN3237_c0_g1~~TRINITY_DN3237_c0_g1_i3.p1  ORF type:complete len:974 (+),score=164.83 TRINITY_DN3237_c0_g1_i3:145-2922(+)
MVALIYSGVVLEKGNVKGQCDVRVRYDSFYHARRNTAENSEYEPLQDPISLHPSFISKVHTLTLLCLLLVSLALVAMVALIYSGVVLEKGNVKGQCDVRVRYDSFYHARRNTLEHFSVPPGEALIKNVTVWTVNEGDEELTNHDILVRGGLIVQIGRDIPKPENLSEANVYQFQGEYLTPGLVDIHSHLGVSSYPGDARGNKDSNEVPSDPTYPQLRAMDAINPSDPAIQLILGGGVTTSLVLPASGNLMGGEAAYVKLRGNSVKEMLIPGTPRAFKMTCGENPKRNYSPLNQSPVTRMGSGWLFRKKFYEAADLYARQKEWDCNPTSLRPDNLELSPLISILSGESRLMVHCYKVEDIEMMLRTSDEFGFNVTTFHHGLEAWKIRNELARRGISVATWPDAWGFKMEAYEGSVKAPRLLKDAGVPLILKTDHPVVYAKYFIYEVSKAVHFGLTWQEAIRAATLTPATAMGIGSRVGSIELNKDADFAIWDRHPLALGTTPSHVFIEGNLVVYRQLVGPPTPTPDPPGYGNYPISFPSSCEGIVPTPYVVRGVKAWTLDVSDNVLENATMVVENGIITCIGSYPLCEGNISSDWTTYNIPSGWMIPGLINVGSSIALSEVVHEVNSQDGTAPGSNGANIKAIDGVRLNNYKNRHLEAAFNGSVTISIVSPQTIELVAGQSFAIHLLPTTKEHVLISPTPRSLDVHIGHPQDTSLGSVSNQIATLRQYFMSAYNSTNPETQIFRDVLDKRIPLVVYVNQVDQIDSMIELKKALGFDMVVVGGAETHLIADHIAANNVGVILNPARHQPDGFETWHASPEGVYKLATAGVKVGLSLVEPDIVRTLRWEAGIAQAGGGVLGNGLSYSEALKMVTLNVAELFRMNNLVGSLEVGKVSSFGIFSGDPLTTATQVLLVGSKDYVVCSPIQY